MRYLILLLIPLFLFADVTDSKQAASILTLFVQETNAWKVAIIPLAINLFAALVTLGFLVNLILLGLENGAIPDFSSITNLIVKEILIIGFFMALIQHSDWLLAIQQSFSQMADLVNGGKKLDPDNVIEYGINIVNSLWNGLSLWHMGDSLALVIAGIIMLGCFTLIGANLLMIIVKIYVLIAIAPFIFALGALTRTRDIAFNPLITIFKCGLELFLLKLFMAVTLTKMQYFADNVGTDNVSVLIMLSTSILLCSVVLMTHEIVESISSGSLVKTSFGGVGMAQNLASATSKIASNSKDTMGGISKVSSSVASKMTKNIDVKPPM